MFSIRFGFQFVAPSLWPVTAWARGAMARHAAARADRQTAAILRDLDADTRRDVGLPPCGPRSSATRPAWDSSNYGA